LASHLPIADGGSVSSEDAAKRGAADLEILNRGLEALVAEVDERQRSVSTEPLRRAFAMALRAHQGQRRKSGEPYLMHPLRVARSIARLGLDLDCVIAGVLHDCIEDSDLTVVDVAEHFGPQVSRLVDGVTKLGKVPYLSRQEQQAESFRKMLLAMSRDIRVLIVKLSDRLDNMRTLEHMPAEKRERIARETMEIYAPLAARLGLETVRHELQDLSFRYLEPRVHAEIGERMQKLFDDEPNFVASMVADLRSKIEAPATLATPSQRIDEARTIEWSIEKWGAINVRATLRTPFIVQHLEAARGPKGPELGISELATFQLITTTREACYTALGHFHGAYRPVPGQFRDYISIPRSNGYQALHTTVFDRSGRRIELQIRSQAMDEVAERGILARLQKDAGVDGNMPDWVRGLMDWQGDVPDPNEFIANVKAELFADEVYVFTPKGDVQVLQRNATPIDFAFLIHTDVGLHCAGARVNGQFVPLRYRLRQGDTVEIVTNPRVSPKPEWVSMCESARAKARISQYLRQNARESAIETGRATMIEALEISPRDLLDLEESGRLGEALPSLGIGQDRGAAGLYEDLGVGRISADSVKKVLLPESDGKKDTKSGGLRTRGLWSRVLSVGRKRKQTETSAPTSGDRPTHPLVIDRDSLASRGGSIELAACCSPLPGDPVTGFSRRGKGLIVHVQGCPEALKELDATRRYVAWADGLDLLQPITLRVRTLNSVGLLAEMSRVFSQKSVNIRQANCRGYDRGRKALNTFEATVESAAQAEDLMAALRKVNGVYLVERVLHHRRDPLAKNDPNRGDATS
jgi:GTP pyrophosphokinase